MLPKPVVSDVLSVNGHHIEVRHVVASSESPTGGGSSCDRGHMVFGHGALIS
jgi:hypothetical protein